MKNKSLLVFLLIFSSCSEAKLLTPREQFSRERHAMIGKALDEFKMKAQVRGYKVSGITEGINHQAGKQNLLGVYLIVDSLPNINYARQEILCMINIFLCSVNQTPEIKGYLDEFPFTTKNIRLNIIDTNQNNNGGLCNVAFLLGSISYSIRKPDRPNGAWIEIHEETYDEALAIVNESQQPCCKQQ